VRTFAAQVVGLIGAFHDSLTRSKKTNRGLRERGPLKNAGRQKIGAARIAARRSQKLPRKTAAYLL
jgi:hypothetical protein